MSTIMVTGTAGFIGFYVARALLGEGATVIGIDNFNPYYSPELKTARDEILRKNRNFVSINADISDLSAVNAIFSEHKPDLVCHLAAQAGVRYSLKNPYTYQKSNLEGFVNLIEQSRHHSVQRFVYASSSSVYGGNTKLPYAENDHVETPMSLYAATKRANELIAYTYTHLWNLQTIGLRFFTVYGPWGRPDMAYWSFLEAMRHGTPIKVFNYGKNKRDFTYIDDVTSGVIAALKRDKLDQYEIINLGNNKPIELMDFISTLEELTGLEAIKEMVPPQPGDVIATFASIDKATAKLGFKPSTSLREGLAQFVRWYEDNPTLVKSVRDFRLSASNK
ncbi:MAG: NAD-dependent epimerase/dehydratase family protein [Deltaproteobacteria bacterium]|nr:NAD-dependent epimerase/dehydratase family protein [Deltaproteobacteria bacterium]